MMLRGDKPSATLSLLKNKVAVSGSPYSLEVLHTSGPRGRKVVPVGNHVAVMKPVLKRVDKSERPTYAEIVGNSRKKKVMM